MTHQQSCNTKKMRRRNEFEPKNRCKTSYDINANIIKQTKEIKHDQDIPKSTQTLTKRSILTNEAPTIVDNSEINKKRKVSKKKKDGTILPYVHKAVEVLKKMSKKEEQSSTHT